MHRKWRLLIAIDPTMNIFNVYLNLTHLTVFQISMKITENQLQNVYHESKLKILKLKQPTFVKIIQVLNPVKRKYILLHKNQILHSIFKISFTGFFIFQKNIIRFRLLLLLKILTTMISPNDLISS